MSTYDISLRCVTEDDAPTLRYLAEQCPPLDVHTHYTYWVLCKFFSESCFILKKYDMNIGYITAISTEDCVFIWQIGILNKHRSCGYSKVLIEAVSEYAKKLKKNIRVSISETNERSYNAFSSFCKANNLIFTQSGELSIRDLVDSSFSETEKIYDIIFDIKVHT